MERQIDETFPFLGETLKVVRATNLCRGCYFVSKENICTNRKIITGQCDLLNRDDGNDVIFKAV